jgi:hypothetical protein
MTLNSANGKGKKVIKRGLGGGGGGAYIITLKLVPKGPAVVLKFFCVFEVFMSWDLGHEANPKSAKGRLDRAVRLDKPH